MPGAISDQVGLTVGKATTLHYVADAVLQDTVAVSIQTAFQGGKFWENFLSFEKAGAIKGITASLAREIGLQKYENGLDPFTHKVLHGIVGGLGAKLEGSDFASGALGAVVAETVAELVDEYDSYKPVDDADHP